MTPSTAIGMVSKSLRNLLAAKLLEMGLSIDVTVLSPDEPSTDMRLNLFLYRVQENSALKNMDWQLKPEDPTQLIPPPLSLNLFYLMTPYAPNDSLTGNSTAHEILGAAMRVFHEHPVIPQDFLEDEIKITREQIKIIQNTLDMEELSQIWSTFSKPFRLSVLYEVSVIQIDLPQERPVPVRVRKIGMPQERVPFNPPFVESIETSSSQEGINIIFHGQHFSGWQAYVTLSGITIVKGMEIIDDNVFTVFIPENLSPGFYDVEVDISHLFKRTFFFEVSET